LKLAVRREPLWSFPGPIPHYESAATHANVAECVRGRRTPNKLSTSERASRAEI